MILTAFPVGFFAGLFGIGGGLITVPFLFFIFDALNIDRTFIMHLAVGTSFAIIIPTSLVSVLTHKKHNSVDFNVLKTYGLFVICGVVLGTLIAAMAQTKSLVLFFSIIVYCLGAYLLNMKDKINKLKSNFNLLPRIIFGILSGLISATMGIGGAIMNVPILRYFGYPINKAIGSAAAIGFIISVSGSIGFFLSGLYLNSNIPLSIGFINIPAFFIFVPLTTFMARIGANTVHRMNKIKAQRMFGIFLYVIGTIFLYRFLNL
mgnify:CR=1 FL=1